MGIEAIFSWLAAFFDDHFLTIFLATVGLFLIMFITWWVYKQLSMRNIFKLFTKTEHKSNPTGWDHFLYIMKYFLLFPVIVFIGFLIFAFSLFLLSKPETVAAQESLLFIAIVMVSTIRIGAYVNEGLAEDLAKLIPLSMLAIVLTNPQFDSTMVTLSQATTFLSLIPTYLKYIIFTITLEAVLRGGTWLFANMGVETEAASAKQ